MTRYRFARVLIAAALLLSLPVEAGESGFSLGEVPRLFVPQDVPPSARQVVPKAARTRAEVVQLYRDVYLPGNAVPLDWTGSIAGCAPGTTNVEHQQAVIDRVNYFRALVELPPVTLLTGTPTVQSQAAALMMSAHNGLSHTPPMNWTCYSAEGATGAMNTNLALGITGVNAIDGYMTDQGAGNAAVGHRRWILFPPRTAMATGDVPGGNQPPRPANALFVFGPSGPRPATPDGIAWPPRGFVPYQNLPANSNRWSFSYPGADFANAQVAMSGPSGPIAVTREPLQMGFGDNTIVFLPDGVPYAKPSQDTTYTVTISNVGGSNVPSSFTYTVTVIDPDAAPPVPPEPETATAIEYYNASLDHYFITHLPAEIATLDAGVTIRGWARTGQSFKVYTSAGAQTSPVCRFYIPPASGDSHFYGRGTTECTNTGLANPTFINEDSQFFHVVLPVNGVCPDGTIAVYRVFSNRPDANHRYMIVRGIRDDMVAVGWLAEGDGPDLVVMCVPV